MNSHGHSRTIGIQFGNDFSEKKDNKRHDNDLYKKAQQWIEREIKQGIHQIGREDNDTYVYKIV